MKRALAVILSSLLVAMPAFADRTVYAPVRLAPTATAGTILFGDGTAAAPSMSFSADPDNGMYRATSNVLSFSAGGVGQAHIQSNTLWFGRAIVISGANPTNFDVIPGYSNSTDIAGTNLRISGGPSTGSAAGGALIFQTSPAGSTGSTANSSVERMRITSGNDVYFGNGTTNASPANPTIRATGGTGSNVAGGELNLYGGQSTGSGAGGPIRFFTSAAGSSGSSPNSNTERMRVTSAGELLVGTTTAQTGSRYVFDGATNTFRIQGDTQGILLLEDKGVADGSEPFQYLMSDGGTLIFGNADRSGTGTSGSTTRMTITATGQILTGDGTAAAPVLSFSADTDTGMYRGGTDAVGIAAGGAIAATFFASTVVLAGPSTSTTPVAAIIRPSIASGTDKTGVNLDIRGGGSTGAGAGGAILFSTSAAGSAGSSINNATERVRVKQGGQVRFVPLAADPTLDVEDGDVYYNSATNKLRVRAGGAWVDLH
jgi:hypothetical protein